MVFKVKFIHFNFHLKIPYTTVKNLLDTTILMIKTFDKYIFQSKRVSLLSNQLYVLVWLFFLLPFFSLSQPFSAQLTEKNWLSISDGLAHNGVTSILEDSQGFLWIGTYDGLNRYDGYEIKVFKNTVEQKIFTSNRIRTINEDQNGNLWIGTDEGISIYNPNKEHFKNIYSNLLKNQKLSGPIVRKIIFSEKHNVAFCATEGFGILELGLDFSFKTQYLPPLEGTVNTILFYDGIPLDENNYLFSTSNGMYLFDFSTKEFTHILKDKISFSKSITKTDTNEILATKEAGFTVFNYTVKNNSYNFTWKKNYLEDTRFMSSGIDSLGNLWLGTQLDGVIRIDNFSKQKLEPIFQKKLFEIDNLRTSFFHFTKNNGTWVGTFNRGLYNFDLQENPFKYYNAEMDLPYGLTTNRISSFSWLDRDRFFINAIRGGLALFNIENQAFQPLPFSIPKALDKRVAKVFVDSRKNTWLWFSEGNGLKRVRNGKNNLEEINYSGLPILKDLSVRYITQDNDGNIWLAAVEGVYKIILDEANEIEQIISLNDHPFFEKNNKILTARYIYTDIKDKGTIWIGTQTKGLFRIKLGNSITLQDASFEQFLHDEKKRNSLPSNFVTCILRIPDGSLWIGTERAGISFVIEKENGLEFTTYSESEGLSNNVVKAIIYDNENLWIPTNIGLNKFDLNTKRFQTFRKTDGLPFEDFEYFTEKSSNGLLFFSSTNGFCFFDPDDMKTKESLPTLVLSDLKLFGKTVQPNDTTNGRVILKQSLNNSEKIKLSYDENVFSIGLKSLHFSNPDNYYIRHQLLPINENWIKISSDQKEISYNGLPPNDYTFRVQASNSQEEWTDIRSLKISIAPPFWKTTWAYLLYALLFFGIIGLVVYVFLRIQSLNHNLTIEKIEKDSIKELNASKLRFFSNIAHEIKTPIALISGSVDLMLNKFKTGGNVNENLERIKRQSGRINQLVEQVHDFQKADANVLKMKNTHFLFDDFAINLIKDFRFMAKQEQKEIFFKSNDEPIYVLADKKKLEKIFNNLLSNAFKYSQAGDQITFSYYRDNNNLIVQVQDTGRGISEEDLPHIFKRFYQSENNLTKVGGAGIGLAFSKKLVDMHLGYIDVSSKFNEGSTFSVRLPIIKEHLPQDIKDREKAILKEEENFLTENLIDRKVALENIILDTDFSKTKIFLAEDNPELRNFITEVLSKFFTVKSFSNGRKCWEAMKDEWPDLLVSDVSMPEMNGFELCRNIKSDIKTSHIPIILLTALTSIENQIEGLEVGADNYVKKPFDVQHLVLSINALLKSRKQLRERFQIDYPMGLEKSQHNENDAVFLEKLFEIMEINLDNQEVEIDSFAKKLHLNRTHFYQKVKALTDQTPYELMKDFRLKKAAEMLINRDLSVSQVYTMSGFKSRTHFSKLFKEKYNISPGKYGK